MHRGSASLRRNFTPATQAYAVPTGSADASVDGNEYVAISSKIVRTPPAPCILVSDLASQDHIKSGRLAVCPFVTELCICGPVDCAGLATGGPVIPATGLEDGGAGAGL